MVPETLPVLAGVSVTDPDPEAVTDPELMGPLIVLVQENVVPPMEAVGTKLSVSPLQISWEYDVGLFVITGTGLTVAVTLNAGPGHPFADGVMV
jgi:hypothetical protein